MMAGLYLQWCCYALVCGSLTVTMAAQHCSYTTYSYNRYDSRFEMMVTYKNCQWGCCWKFEDPCCSLPVGLVVGCVVAGVLLIGLVTLVACCCCMCRRRAAPPNASGGVVYALNPDRSGTHIPMNMMNSSSLPPGVYAAPPPSYEEVMAGERNLAFKHESEH